VIVAAIPESSWDTRYIHSVGHESIPSTASSKLISGPKTSLVAAPIAMALATTPKAIGQPLAVRLLLLETSTATKHSAKVKTSSSANAAREWSPSRSPL
jgi:hypothetical protein